MYQVEIGAGAQRQIRRLPDLLRERLMQAIESLGENPRPPGVTKLSGMEGYRIRVGDYRILCWIEDTSQRIEVYRVMARSDVYKVR